MNQAELCFLTAREMARLIRRKEISARDLLEQHLRRIEQINPKVNAIVTLVADRARADAAAADEEASKGEFRGALHGLPVAHKDLEDTAGIRTTYGSPIFRDHVPQTSALVVERMQAAGAITLGKTNTPEFGAGSQTFNPVFGATRNPYDLTKTCGGSSGGAAVALACGMIALADGSDMGGSLRNPASFCSVVGLRPSPGRVARLSTSTAWSTLNVVGPMARTAEDAALLLSAIGGPDARDPLSIHESGAKFGGSLDRDFRGVRVAWFKDLGGLPFAREIREVVDARRSVFEDLGCETEQDEPDFDGADFVFRVLRAVSFHATHGPKLAQYRSMMKEPVIAEIETGARLTGADVSSAEVKRSLLYQRAGEFFERYEFFVLPVTQVTPFDVNQPYVTEIDGKKLEGYIDWMRSCYYISVLGLPAISVPAGFTADGLPVGLQIVGRHQDDLGVLQLAHAFQKAANIARLPQL